MKSTTLAVAALLTITTGVPAARAADTIAARVSAARASGSSTWLTWSAPSVVDGFVCCSNGRDWRTSRTCSLGDDGYGMNLTTNDGAPKDTAINVFVHVGPDGIDRVRAYSASCQVERGSATLESVAGVRPDDSVSFLASLVQGSDERASKRRSDSALSAIALHDAPSADPMLERAARDGDTKSLRHSAAFWLGNTRGRGGYEALSRLRTSGEERFREHLTFCFSQNSDAGAQTELIDMAKNDPAPRVRGQALFWIAQKAQKKSDADIIRQAVENDPDTEIKEKAVFALSQIPRGEGVPDLIRVAKENKNREVRKKAMFWLGQSKDPRALEFFESILRP